ncbi:MAG: hypothetical protein ABSG92_02915 [Conexivisphaerales archaeon]|jgi:transcription initiation factor IIE alpha subunit
MEAKCPRCAEKGDFDPATQVFTCHHCGTVLGFDDFVAEFQGITDEKALDYIGRGNPTP